MQEVATFHVTGTRAVLKDNFVLEDGDLNPSMILKTLYKISNTSYVSWMKTYLGTKSTSYTHVY